MKERKSLNPFANKEIENVEIVFENCEVFTIPADGIDRLYIGDIHYSFDIHPNGLSKWTKAGETSCWAFTDEVYIILNEKGMNIRSDWKEMFDDAELLKDRISGNDITHLDFNFTDNTNIYIGVPWEDGKTEWDNAYQHNTIKNKRVFIDIAKDINKEAQEKDNEEYYNFEIGKDEEHKCVQCGKPTNDKQLKSGAWACKKCLDDLGKEQRAIKSEVEYSLTEYGLEEPKDICELLDTFDHIIDFIQKNSSVETIKHLKDCLGAINTVLKIENNLLEKDKLEEVLKEYQKFSENL